MPLHIFLSTWLGTSLHLLTAAKILKDIVLVIGFGAAVAASLKQPWLKALLKDKLVWLIGLYGLLTLGLALLRPTDQDAETLGVVYNLRFLIFFLYAILLSRLTGAETLRRRSLQIVIAVATVVLFFGIIQYTLLPDDALSRVGYARENGVLPAFFIDDKPDLERIMSTLRDPNSFGSYILIPGMLAAGLLLRRKLPRQLGFGLLALSVMCLLFTFSRSAWIGFCVALAVLLTGHYGRRIWQPRYRRPALLLSGVVLAAAVSLYPLRDTYLVENIIFHADESTVLEDPNELRARFWQESIDNIKEQPLGYGPGTAGLASIRNDVQGTTLNENYYLQIAHEVGVLGLIVFLSILGIVAWRLFQQSPEDALALALLASFAGLALTNLLVHIWSNEAVAYTWWGLAGLALAATGKKRS